MTAPRWNHPGPRLLLACALAAAACAPAATRGKAPHARPSLEARHTRIAIDGGWIHADIRLPKDTDKPVPVVVSPLNSDHDLLGLGIGTVRFQTNWEALRGFRKKPAPEPDSHESGEEKPLIGRWILASDRPGNVGQGYFDIITYEASHAVPKVVRALEMVDGIDHDRIGIAGSSTSGFLALQAFAGEKKLAAAFVRAATGDYECFLRYSDLAFADNPRWLHDGKPELDPDYAARLPRMDPATHVDRFPPRPLMLITGADDTAIPRRCVEQFASAVERAYAKAGVPQKFDWREVAGATHNLPSSTLTTALRFWTRTLQPPSPRPAGAGADAGDDISRR